MIVKHYHVVLFVLLLIYVGTAVSMGVFYMGTRCPYSSLTACQTANVNLCGQETIGDVSECEKFVSDIEPCYCNTCRFCLTPGQQQHCKLSKENRLRMCETQLKNI